MKLKRKHIVLGVYVVIIISAFVYFGALQQFGYKGFEFELEGRDNSLNLLDFLILGITIASFALLFISLLAYKRTKDLRILVVSSAFFFFAIKEFLFVMENFFPHEFVYIDNAERVLELLILLSFIMLMYGVGRRYDKLNKKR